MGVVTPSWSPSLRWRLSATYAALALLTAVLVGGLLIVLLDRHFAQIDRDRLRSVADHAAISVSSPGAADLTAVLRSTAFTMNARVEALGPDGTVVADSGSPASIPAATVGNPTGVNAPSDREVRSALAYDVLARPGSPTEVTTLRASEGPASGAGVVEVVTTAWEVAAVLAVAAAAGVGYLLSGRIARPIGRLAAASDLMAAGDLTARVNVEAGDEIGRLAQSFNRMAERVTDNVGSLQRFVSDAAHQIGTPLTALRTDLEVIRESATDADGRRRADRALAQEARLSELAGGLLRLSRLDSAPPLGVHETVTLLPHVRAAADGIASRAEQAGIELLLDDDDPAHLGVKVAATSEALRDILGNLLDNAVKFTPCGGQVRVSLRADQHTAVVAVADTGPGIPDAERDLVFERFYRSPSATDFPGNGLGLPIARRTAESLGGTIRMAPGGPGTCMELRLPTASG